MVVTSYLAHNMLANFSWYVITQIKKPLQDAIIIAANRFTKQFGGVKVNETCSQSVHSLIEIQQYLLGFDIFPDRKKLLDSAMTILEFEIEHDPDYRAFFDIVMDEIVKKVLDGKWEVSGHIPDNVNWTNPPPFTQKSSIIYRLMLYREEINRVLRGDKI